VPVTFAWLFLVVAAPVAVWIWIWKAAEIEGAQIAIVTVFVAKAPRILGIGNAILVTAPDHTQGSQGEQRQHNRNQPTHKLPPRFTKRRYVTASAVPAEAPDFAEKSQATARRFCVWGVGAQRVR